MADTPILALVLFLPWFAILGTLYWLFPRTPHGPARRGFDIAVLALSLALSVWAMHWGHASADPQAGTIWRQVLATLVAYGAFLGVLAIAWPLRSRMFPPR